MRQYSSFARISGALLSLGAITVGVALYLADRPPESVYFVNNSPVAISFYEAMPNIFGVIGYNLPSFLHVFAFIVLTAMVINGGKGGLLAICAVWFAIDSLFELGQKYGLQAAEYVPGWFVDIPFLNNTKSYFLKGTFDFLDIIATALGAIVAYFISLALMDRRIQ